MKINDKVKKYIGFIKFKLKQLTERDLRDLLLFLFGAALLVYEGRVEDLIEILALCGSLYILGDILWDIYGNVVSIIFDLLILGRKIEPVKLNYKKLLRNVLLLVMIYLLIFYLYGGKRVLRFLMYGVLMVSIAYIVGIVLGIISILHEKKQNHE